MGTSRRQHDLSCGKLLGAVFGVFLRTLPNSCLVLSEDSLSSSIALNCRTGEGGQACSGFRSSSIRRQQLAGQGGSEIARSPARFVVIVGPNAVSLNDFFPAWFGL